MSSTNTQGPLIHKGHGVILGGAVITLPRGDVQQQVAMCTVLDDGDKDANARRLVACWNFCEGVETGTIESTPANLATLFEGVKVESELITAWRQRAQQAVDALAKVETYMQERVGSNPGSRGATVILPMIRAAIEGAGVAPTQSTWADC